MDPADPIHVFLASRSDSHPANPNVAISFVDIFMDPFQVGPVMNDRQWSKSVIVLKDFDSSERSFGVANHIHVDVMVDSSLVPVDEFPIVGDEGIKFLGIEVIESSTVFVAVDEIVEQSVCARIEE